jgi:hypothetical protein
MGLKEAAASATRLHGMEIRIGVVHTPKELSVEVEEPIDDVKRAIADALANDDGVLWLTDTHGRTVGVPAERVAYVEIETDGAAKRVGFGRG